MSDQVNYMITQYAFSKMLAGEEIATSNGVWLKLSPELRQAKALPMILHCPECEARHVDVGEFATKPHHTHACQHCGFVWRPAVIPTVGVQFLPGFKDGET